MNILQLTNKVPYPPRDGGAIATLNMATGFTNLGHKVSVLAMNTSKHFFDIEKIPDNIKTKINFHDVKVNTRIKYTEIIKNLLFSKMPYNAQRFLSENYSKKLTEILISNDYDIIQLEGLYLTPYIPEIRKHSKGLIALRAHNIEHEIWERIASQQKFSFKKFYCKEIARRVKNLKKEVINKYDVLIPITDRDSKRFEDLGNEMPTHVVPAGIDTEKLIPQPEKIVFPSVCHIGTLDWMPNQEGLIWFLKNAWEQLNELHPDLEFNIAGRNAPEWLNKLFNSYNVNFYGEIADAYDFINKNAIMVAPLFSGSGMRVKIIEGMALGKAIITTPVGIEGIPATNGKNIIIEETPEGFIKQIDKLIKNRESINEIGKNAIKFVKENFDNTNISAALIDFYHKQLK